MSGNGWAAAGMLRVLSTLNHSSYAQELQSEQADLTKWIHEILEASWDNQVCQSFSPQAPITEFLALE